MDIKNLSKIADSKVEPTAKPKKKVADSRKSARKNSKLEKRIADARYKKLRKRIKDAVEETETTEDAIAAIAPFLEDSDPAEVLEATVEILAETVDVLSEIVEEGLEPEE